MRACVCACVRACGCAGACARPRVLARARLRLHACVRVCVLGPEKIKPTRGNEPKPFLPLARATPHSPRNALSTNIRAGPQHECWLPRQKRAVLVRLIEKHDARRKTNRSEKTLPSRPNKHDARHKTNRAEKRLLLGTSCLRSNRLRHAGSNFDLFAAGLLLLWLKKYELVPCLQRLDVREHGHEDCALRAW